MEKLIVIIGLVLMATPVNSKTEIPIFNSNCNAIENELDVHLSNLTNLLSFNPNRSDWSDVIKEAHKGHTMMVGHWASIFNAKCPNHENLPLSKIRRKHVHKVFSSENE